MTPRQRIVHWLLSPVVLFVASFSSMIALEEWQSVEMRAAYERETAGRRAKAPAEKPQPPLFKAIWQGGAAEVKSAIAEGADPNAPNDRGILPLHAPFYPGRAGRRDIVEALLDGGADVNTPRVKFGDTALHMAVRHSQREVVELLLDRGADINARNKDGKTPLMDAGQLEIAELLIARGAKWETGETGIDPTGARLREAARKGDVKLIELLLSKGADVNRRTKARGTPLLLAVAGRHTEAVRTLLTAGAKPETRIEHDGSDLLHIVAEMNELEIASLLIAAGANVNAARKSGWTPLHIASSRCHEDVADLLIANGANRNALDKHGKAPLPCYAFAKKPPRGAAKLIVSCRV